MKKEITVRTSTFTPEVKFQYDFNKNITKEQIIKKILELWSDMTGLCFDKMKVNDFSHIHDDNICFEVESPLTNRPNVTFYCEDIKV
jgi:hypothetical protein